MVRGLEEGGGNSVARRELADVLAEFCFYSRGHGPGRGGRQGISLLAAERRCTPGRTIAAADKRVAGDGLIAAGTLPRLHRARSVCRLAARFPRRLEARAHQSHRGSE